MKVFITGATGFVGTHVIENLNKRGGYEVIGLARSDEGVKKLEQLGAKVLRGGLEDSDVLRQGAAEADAIIHLAFDHSKLGTSKFAEACALDKGAIEIFAGVVKGTNKPVIFTSGTLNGVENGKPAVESYTNLHSENPRSKTEAFAKSLSEEGVNIKIVRLPQVHNTKRWGLLTYMLVQFRKNGEAVYLGDGSLGTAAVSVFDAAEGYVKVLLDKSKPGTTFHLVGEEGVKHKDWVTALAQISDLPVKSADKEEVAKVAGFFNFFMSIDMSAKSEFTRKTLNWKPEGPSLIENILASENPDEPV